MIRALLILILIGASAVCSTGIGTVKDCKVIRCVEPGRGIRPDAPVYCVGGVAERKWAGVSYVSPLQVRPAGVLPILFASDAHSRHLTSFNENTPRRRGTSAVPIDAQLFRAGVPRCDFTSHGLYQPPVSGYYKLKFTYPIAQDTCYLYVDKEGRFPQWYLVRVSSPIHLYFSFPFNIFVSAHTDTLTLLKIYGRYMPWSAVDSIIADKSNVLLVAEVHVPRAPGLLKWFASPLGFHITWWADWDRDHSGIIDLSDFTAFGEEYGAKWKLPDLGRFGELYGGLAFYEWYYVSME